MTDWLLSLKQEGWGILSPLTCLKLHGVNSITITKKVQDGWATVALEKERPGRKHLQ